ncbi:MarR family winged helix-turn-helix transcriptional regulator [Stutzerimonas nosocomialis]|uniref:MarR family winged helix-turn-helix transcriptional regulator n=1 Tax=Stutzerimonas nosocomialis TaxID=1056496 RepID=UPI001577116D|nr:MarR family winged helix-turn-helix transcriptional regulator [Stutzerimonas nosocomialis]
MRNLKIENMVGALALALSDGVLQSTQNQAPEAGPAAAAIALLGHEPGMTIERLRRALRLSHPGAVRLVDRLVAEGVVERRPSATDRRAVALHLTEAGRANCEAVLAVRQDHIAHALETLSPIELETLGLLTEKLLRGLVRDLDQAYSVCRLCDPGVCTNCPVGAALEEGAGECPPAETRHAVRDQDRSDEG